MSQVYLRGQTAYQCDTCNRKTRVVENKYGLDVIQRCIITAGCLGKLYKVQTKKEVYDTPPVTPEVPGLEDWFQRKVLYTYTQSIESNSWTIQHNLGSKPIVHVLVNRQDPLDPSNTILVEVIPKKVTLINLNVVQVEFDTNESGVAQCVAAASANTTNPPTQFASVNVENYQLTNNGILTVATLDSSPLVDIDLVYTITESSQTIQYTGIDNTPSIGSPWVNANTVFVNGRTYTVRSFDIVQTQLAPPYFAAGLISNGSGVYFEDVFAPNEVLILLARRPYEVVDRNYTAYIDTALISKTAPQMFYDAGELFAPQSLFKSTYPPIVVVD